MIVADILLSPASYIWQPHRAFHSASRIAKLDGKNAEWAQRYGYNYLPIVHTQLLAARAIRIVPAQSGVPLTVKFVNCNM